MIRRVDMSADDETRCDNFLGALEGLSNLLDAQVPGLSLSSEAVAPLVRVLAEMAREVVPREGLSHRGASNDAD